MDAGASPVATRLVFFTPLLLAVVTAVALLMVPTGREESISVGSSGEMTRSSRSTTLVQSDGWSALVPLAIPVVIAGVPPAFRRSRWRGVALAAVSDQSDRTLCGRAGGGGDGGGCDRRWTPWWGLRRVGRAVGRLACLRLTKARSHSDGRTHRERDAWCREGGRLLLQPRRQRGGTSKEA